MVYLIKGEDFQAKDTKIKAIKDKILTKKDAIRFDFDSFDATKLKPEELKKALIALPVIAKRRLILIRQVEKCSTQNQNLLLDFLNNDHDHCALICECRESSKKAFLSKLSALAKVTDFGVSKKLNVFDMTKAIGSRNSRDALKILSVLLSDGNHPLQIMGGLVWYWGNSKGRILPDNFQKGLRELQEADLNIKRSRLQPEYTLEVLVTKLSLLAT